MKYEVTGPDAGRLIQRRFTNDLSGVGAGQVRYGAFVNADGLMVDDGNVYKHSDQKYWVMINTADLEDWFRETAGGLDAQIAGRTEELPMISATGSDVARPRAGLTASTCRRSATSGSTRTPVQVGGVQTPPCCGRGSRGELGFELVTDPASAPALWQALIEAGGKPFGLDGDRHRTRRGRAHHHRARLPAGRDLAVRRLARPLHQAGDRERGRSRRWQPSARTRRSVSRR